MVETSVFYSARSCLIEFDIWKQMFMKIVF